MGTKTVAVDIGTSVVRVAEVESGSGADPREGATLHAFAERAMPPGVIRKGVIEEPSALAAVVRETINAAKVSSKSVVVGLEHSGVVIREVDIPAQHMDKVRESLAFHVQDLLPTSADESILDFYPTAEYDAPAGPTLRGLLVAAPKEHVSELVSVIEKAGASVAAVDHSALALWRNGCRGALASVNIALVDVGSATTTVTVSQAGVPRLVRTLPQASGDATRAVAEATKGLDQDAETFKREWGMAPNVPPERRNVTDAVAQAMGPLIETVRNTLAYFASSNPGGGIERIVLTGGGSYVQGFGQAFASVTRIPIKVGDPLYGFTLGKKVDLRAIRGREAELATVIGLAMRSKK
ncbi:pilus assembly protein PilM [Demequina sp. TTPB684]|uniref:pilus assembly protein PilM n=1 Tax=unclassified Demequina TaxID=2620311 RepID=UPI001CF28713|nr:pilus assembly protein PilM [Demequina sp. TMPB413]MCB2411671.1 pilus assembly protein PilM [Demequina sp. TTPB684]UPU89241.1 pilus assembly protein PilM [Demequina sp. TMPB413]